MAWFGDGLPSLSNLKGQLTSFTKEVLSEGIVEEIDECSRALEEANERCVQLEELLNSKDAEISLLRRQNCDLQRTVVELNSKSRDSNDVAQDDENEAFFWDPPSSRNRNPRAQNHVRALQEQLAQATMRIRELESELKRVQKVNNSSLKDEMPEGAQRAEYLRAKQDMVNRIIQLEEKSREEAERSTKRSMDEAALINDFRTVISKLNSLEKLDLVRGALKALETENERYNGANGREKSDLDEKFAEDGSRANFDPNPESGLCRRVYNEKLDLSHGNESIEKLISLKEELEKKHQCLQNAYEQLYVDYNQAQDKVVQLETELETVKLGKSIETTCRHVQTNASERYENRDAQTDESIGKDENAMEELERRIKGILKNSCIETEAEESIFEAVARQYVDTKWKKEVLERKVTELTRDLKETAETKDGLQVECEEMQAHIDSLVLQIQDLKLNLPSIPEASEERVASLESETETLQEEVNRLQAENARMKEENSKLRELVEQGEASIRSQESLEAEVRNTRQQLDMTRQQLDGASRNAKSNESLVEDLRSKVNESLEENNRLMKRIEKMGDQLHDSVSEVERSRAELAAFKQAKNELERENEDLFQKREQLEEEIAKWRESNLQNESKEMLEELQERLKNVTREKDDLEYDILNMRRELDEALHQIELGEGQMTKVSQDNEGLRKERFSLLEQLAAIQDESNDKIELLNTEKSLLEQENAELKQEVAGRDEELRQTGEKLVSIEQKYKILESEFSEVNAEAEKLQIENETLQLQTKSVEPVNESNERRAMEELHSVQSKYDQLNGEMEILRFKESQLLTLEGEFVRITDENAELKVHQEELRNKCQEFENAIAVLQAERQELISKANTDASDQEKQQMIRVLEERAREIDSLKNENSKLMAELVETRKKVERGVESSKESADMARQTIESLSHLVKEKDEEIISLKASLDQANGSSVELPENFATMKNERDELVKLVTVKHNESLQYHAEIQRLTHLINEQTAQIQSFLSEQNTNAGLLSQKESELLWARNELQATQQRLRNLEESGDGRETCGIAEHSTYTSEISILTEKCKALEAALVQEQSNNRMIQNQLVESQGKEANAAKELERLRTHLVEIESSYTEEALIAEEARKELEARLQQAEEKVKNSSTVYTSASIRANQQVETLQQQMALIIQQRDDIQSKLSAAEDKVLSQTASLTNLQIVLEQFQRDKDREVRAATERIQAKLNESYRKQEELLSEVLNLKDQLSEAKECLQAASRLSEQLDKKAERIEQLSQEVERLTELVNSADRRIEEAKQSGEGKVDKALIKNLFLGYLSSSAADKSSVLRVFATILDFNETERDKAGLHQTNPGSSWFSRLGAGSAPVSKEQEASLSAAFVRFLESESKPKPQLPALPIQTSPLPRPGHSRQPSSSSTQSTLLLSSVNLPTFPDFVPARNTGSILKEVLKDS